ncbi:MAG: hypothetical protein CL678_00740 [Bdellovibrionaceae bacterium]|nr:hypothetical protein [Pseudobdellovibrionaceae bacterium]|tara:strand:- start:3534 stop:4244 length:711 start_codon:yes stop_codon:yes gene_type:complete
MPAQVGFLDGPPGAGKSTILATLAAKYNVSVFPEPCALWAQALQNLETHVQEIKGCERNGTVGSADHLRELACYELALVHLQTLVLSWFQQLTELVEKVKQKRFGPRVIMIERTPLSARVFHALAADDDNRTFECKAQLNMIAAQLPDIHGTIYFDLRADPDLIMSRLSRRGAPGDMLWSASSVAAYYRHYDVLVGAAELPITTIDVTAEATPSELAATIMSHFQQTKTLFNSLWY